MSPFALGLCSQADTGCRCKSHRCISHRRMVIKWSPEVGHYWLEICPRHWLWGGTDKCEGGGWWQSETETLEAEAIKIDDVRVQSCGRYDGTTKYTSIHFCTYRTAQQKHPRRRILNGQKLHRKWNLIVARPVRLFNHTTTNQYIRH